MTTNTTGTIWKFKTKNFTVLVTAEEEFDLDLSWDDSGEVAEQLDNGQLCAFCAKAAVVFHGAEIGAGYLGDCIYRSPSDFRDHVGLAMKSREDGRNYGSYFPSIVREAIREARAFVELSKAALN
jgi:hypothetical protein